MEKFIHLNKVKIKLQEKKEGVVQPKKAGRPPKPEMEYVRLRLDKGLHAQLKNDAQKEKINKSAWVERACIHYLSCKG